MHEKHSTSNHPSYIFCQDEDNISSILCAKLNGIVQNIAGIMIVMLN